MKVPSKHFALMVVCCLAPIILIIGLSFLLKGGGRTWFWLVMLLCPLLHIWMMKGMIGGKHSHCDTNHKQKTKI